MPRPPGRPAPIPVCPVEQRDDAQVRERLVERVVRRVVGQEALQAGVQLEAEHTVLLHQPTRLLDGRTPPPRVDRTEGDEDVVVPGGRLGDVLAGESRMSRLAG